jgi:hypothetical protein
MSRSKRSVIRTTVALAATLATGAWATAPATTWVIQPSPNPSAVWSVLNGVTVPNATDAWAAGYYTTGNPGVTLSLVEHYDGSTWTQQTTKNPSTAEDELNAIKASSSTDVWAVGEFLHTTGFRRVLIEHYDGTSWTRKIGVSYKKQDNVLNGVAAPSSTNVWAVGCNGPDYFFSCDHALIEHYDGTNWKLQTSAAPPCEVQGTSALSGVSAASSTSVWAVGNYECKSGGSGYQQTFIQHFDGTSWTTQSSHDPGLDNSLLGVSAVSSTDAWAVGWLTTELGGCIPQTYPLIEHFDGTSWTVVDTPIPGPDFTVLTGVKALSSTDAWAVGYYSPVECSSATQTLVMHWDGTAWSIQSSESPSSGANDLYGVGASSTSNAFAVGAVSDGYFFPGSTASTLVEHCC